MSTKGTYLLTEKDFVDAVDANGDELGFQVPKHWGSDDLPPGVEKKSGRGSSSKSKTGGSAKQKADGGKADSSGEQPPPGNASLEDWVAYARANGVADAELLDDKGEPLNRDALRDKLVPPTP